MSDLIGPRKRTSVPKRSKERGACERDADTVRAALLSAPMDAGRVESISGEDSTESDVVGTLRRDGSRGHPVDEEVERPCRGRSTAGDEYTDGRHVSQ